MALAAEDSDAPEELKDDLEEMSETLDEAQDQPPDVQNAATRMAASAIIGVQMINQPTTTPEQEEAVVSLIEELNPSMKVLVNRDTPVAQKAAISKLSINAYATLLALRDPKLTSNARAALTDTLLEQKATLEEVRDPSTPPIKAARLVEKAAPLEVVVRTIANEKASADVRGKAEEILVELTVVLTAYREEDVQPSDRWQLCREALDELKSGPYTALPEQCEGSLSS